MKVLDGPYVLFKILLKPLGASLKAFRGPLKLFGGPLSLGAP